MEPATFTLVIWTTTWALWTTDEIRFPGFGEIECKLLAAERVKPPKKARCEREDTPPKAQYPVICPFSPPCWQDGEPIVGHGQTLPLVDPQPLDES